MTHLLALILLVTSVWSFSPFTPANVVKSRHGARAAAAVPRTVFTKTPLHASKQDTDVEETTKTQQDFTVTFPSHHELMALRPGGHVTSNVIHVTDDATNKTHDFQVLLYPRGGGHSSKNSKPLDSDVGFGMSYKIFGDKNEKVGVYLQYLGDDSVDATFSLRLQGQQQSGPRFDVEWSSGMRFVTPENSNLQQGMANDFGAHLMQTHLLQGFMGVDDGEEMSDENLEAQVSITIHSTPEENITVAKEEVLSAGLLQSISSPLKDIRQITKDCSAHDAEQVRVGKIVVPVLSKLQQRPRMFELGAYPGVEYRIMRIFDSDGQEVFASVPGADYEIRPIYPLVDQLERQWPVRINEAEIPKLLTANMYNVISAIGSLFTAIGGLATAFLVSQAISLFFIPSRSMDPTLQVKDVLVVDKVSPRILGDRNKKIGDVVLFSPPDRLRAIVSSSGGRITDRDLFVKRIAAGPGDTVSVDSSGAVKVNGVSPAQRRDLCGAEPLRLIERYIQPGSFTVKDGQVFVLGDCSSVSVDSRVWGPLQSSEIVGKPIMRIWPLERFGVVPSLPTADADWTN